MKYRTEKRIHQIILPWISSSDNLTQGISIENKMYQDKPQVLVSDVIHMSTVGRCPTGHDMAWS